jgi:alkylated DNA repair dioxygenase AlkB
MLGPSLFGADAPDGFVYRDDFISPAEESALAEAISQIEFANFEMRGMVARRRVAFFGIAYDASMPVRPMPGFLSPIRARLAEWAGIRPQEFAMALINEYRVGAPIGWHRDAPQYDLIAGLTLLSAAPMRLRPYFSPSVLRYRKDSPRRKATYEILLERRSAYLIGGAARSQFEHHIPAVTSLRYSITFRTLRPAAARPSIANVK